MRAVSAVMCAVLGLSIWKLCRTKRRKSVDVQNSSPSTTSVPCDQITPVRSSTPKRVAIIGGAFNPPTHQHLLLAAEIVHSGVVDSVWLAPCGMRTDKKIETSPRQRLVMCELAVATTMSVGFPIAVTDHEIDDAMATYDSLCHLRDRYPQCTFTFVLGSDWLQSDTDIRSWTSREGRTGDRLLKEFDFLVVPRPGYKVPDLKDFGPRFRWISMAENCRFIQSDVSSTEVRRRAKKMWQDEHANPNCSAHSFETLVSSAVYAYIRRYRLYDEKGTPDTIVSRKYKSRIDSM